MPPPLLDDRTASLWGDGFTSNLTLSEETNYRRALKLSGATRWEIRPVAYDSHGRVIDGWKALYIDSDVEKYAMWETYHRLTPP